MNAKSLTKCKWIAGFALLVLLLLSVLRIDLNLYVHVETDNYSQLGIATLFFDEGQGCNEKDVISAIAEDDIITFKIPHFDYYAVENIRLDPINYEHDVAIKRVYFSVLGNELFEVEGTDLVNNSIGYAGVEDFENVDDTVLLKVNGTDPIVFWGNSEVEQYNSAHLLTLICYIVKIICIAAIVWLLYFVITKKLHAEAEALKNVVYNNLCGSHNMKYYVVGMFAVYIFVRLFVLIKYQGYFFSDEFYFCAEGNPDYVSTYNRAPYFAFLIELFTGIAGNNYFAVKASPLFCGLISFCCVMYLVCSVCKNSLSVVSVGALMTFHALFMFNDFYVRMYSFQEMTVLLMAVVLLKIKRSERVLYCAIWGCLGFGMGFIIYRFAADITGRLPLMMYCVALIYIVCGEKLLFYIQKKGWMKYLLTCVGVVFVLAVVLSVLIKKGYIFDWYTAYAPGFFSEVLRMMTEFRVESEVVFPAYLATDGIFLLVGILLAGVWMVKEERKDILPIYVLGVVPITVFGIMLYDARTVRTYISYIAVLVVVAVFFGDRLLTKKSNVWLVMLGCIFTIAASPLDLTWKQFSEQLYLYHEIYFCDYGALMEDTEAARAQGKKIAALFGGEQTLAHFELDADVNLCVWDNNQDFNYSNEELLESLEEITKVEGEFVLIMDKTGADKLHEIGKYYTILDEHEYKMYNRGIEFNSLYLVDL